MIDARFAVAVLAWYALISTGTLVVLWRDRRSARQGGWRTAEATLHLLELLGGWPGTLIGQRLLHHKSRKMSYRLIMWLIAAAHIAAWAALTWSLVSRS